MVCRFIERRRQSFFLTNKIGVPTRLANLLRALLVYMRRGKLGRVIKRKIVSSRSFSCQISLDHFSGTMGCPMRHKQIPRLCPGHGNNQGKPRMEWISSLWALPSGFHACGTHKSSAANANESMNQWANRCVHTFDVPFESSICFQLVLQSEMGIFHSMA